MKSENKYIGDDKFKKFLEHYNCPTPLEVVKLRFAGAVCSPNSELRPTDVIASFWQNNLAPRLETKNEAELFFKFFMGLWDEMFELVSANSIVLPRIESADDLITVCEDRYNELELGFVEGFWGGKEDIKVPAYIAEVIDSLTQLAEVYRSLVGKISPEKNNKNVFDAIIQCDKMAAKSINMLIEHYVLPHIDSLRRVVN
ncbi:MAG: hypothetical protein ACI4OE_05050 [Alphaproteobacteria bacterium]